MKKLLVLSLCASVLTSLCACARPDKGEFTAEVKEREDYARKTLSDSDAGDTLNVSSTSEIEYGAGFGLLTSNPTDDFRAGPFRWMGANAHIRLKSHGRRKMKIVIAGWINEKMVQTRPSMDVYIDNYLVNSSAPFETDHYWFDFITPEWVFEREWVDLTIRMTAVGYHWDAPPALKTLVLYRFEYKEAD